MWGCAWQTVRQRLREWYWAADDKQGRNRREVDVRVCFAPLARLPLKAPHPAAPARLFPELTERETEVLSLIARGRTNEEIARELVLSLKTVRNHASNIFSKLQVADRAQAVIRAREAGLGGGRS
jgi:DNA-binding NarL/FixJ family response regulator